MRSLIVAILLFSSLCAYSQIDDKFATQKAKFYSDQVLIGQWISPDKKEFFIEKAPDGKMRMTDIKNFRWYYLTRSGSNKYNAYSSSISRYIITIESEKEIKISEYDESGIFNIDGNYQITDITYSPPTTKEMQQLKRKNDRSYFAILYPSLNSIMGIYGGMYNKKVSLYLGLRVSKFTNYSEEGGPYESEGVTMTTQPEGTHTMFTGDEDFGQSSISIGMTSPIIKNKLYTHYGLGYGIYNSYKAFDIWEFDESNDWQHKKTVWANDKEAEVSGLLIEGGLIYDAGILISAGVGLLGFEKFDVMFGIGYAF